MVRVVTVHGAKGLEAPIVFLADAGPRQPSRRGRLLWSVPEPDGTATALPFWRAARPASAGLTEARRRRASAAAELEERRRLLYVALTRARDRLYVTGWLPRTASAPRTSRCRGLASRAGTSLVAVRWLAQPEVDAGDEALRPAGAGAAPAAAAAAGRTGAAATAARSPPTALPAWITPAAVRATPRRRTSAVAPSRTRSRPRLAARARRLAAIPARPPRPRLLQLLPELAPGRPAGAGEPAARRRWRRS